MRATKIMQKKQIDIKDLTYRKNSALISIDCSPYSTMERMLYDGFLMATSLQLEENPEQTVFETSITELKRFSNIKDNNGARFKRSIQGLQDKPIEIDVLGKNGGVWDRFRIIGGVRIEYNKYNNRTRVRYNHDFQIIELIKNPKYFAVIGAIVKYGVSEKYALSLLHHLFDYYDKGGFLVTVEQARKILGAGDKYIGWSMFERRVLKKAIDECNNHLPFQTEYSIRRKGRKVTHIEFKIIKSSSINEEVAEQLRYWGVIEPVILNQLNEDEQRVVNAIEYTEKEIESGALKNGKYKPVQIYMRAYQQKRGEKSQYEIEQEEDKKKKEQRIKDKKQAQEKLEQLRSEYYKYKAEVYINAFRSLEDDEQERIKQDFEKSNPLKKKFDLKSRAIKSLIVAYLEQHINPELMNMEEFAKSKKVDLRELKRTAQ